MSEINSDGVDATVGKSVGVHQEICGKARDLLNRGRPAQAFDLLERYLDQIPEEASGRNREDTVEVRLLQVVSLTRGGNHQLARSHLKELRDIRWEKLPPRLAADLACQWGRVLQGRFTRERDPAQRRLLLLQAAEWFDEARRRDPTWHYPCGVAALLHAVAKNSLHAKDLAAEARRLTSLEDADGYWCAATLALVALVERKQEEFCKRVIDARRFMIQEGALGSLASLRRDCRLFKIEMKEDYPDEQEHCVLTFAGHMIDHPAESSPRFPAGDGLLQEKVRREIEKRLANLKPLAVYCSLASGSDILFLEALLERGKKEDYLEIHIVLPFQLEDFFASSVSRNEELFEIWEMRARRILANEHVEKHFLTEERSLGNEALLFALCNRFTQGLAIMRASELCVEPRALVVVDRDARCNPKVGGTAFFLRQWDDRPKANPAEIIDLTALREGGEQNAAPLACPVVIRAPASPDRTRCEKSLLFADVKEFSSIGDEAIVRFMTRFYAKLRELQVDHFRRFPKPDQERRTNPEMTSNTWGDALYAVFETAPEAADFAVRMLASVETLFANDEQLAGKLALRIGLHSGPVFTWTDPVTGRDSCFGRHVTHAARIEPVVVPGCAFASEQFAALLTSEASGRFVCERVGQFDLPKGHGTLPLYSINPCFDPAREANESDPSQPTPETALASGDASHTSLTAPGIGSG